MRSQGGRFSLIIIKLHCKVGAIAFEKAKGAIILSNQLQSLYNVIVFWIETVLNTSQPFLSAWFFMNFKLLELFTICKTVKYNKLHSLLVSLFRRNGIICNQGMNTR